MTEKSREPKCRWNPDRGWLSSEHAHGCSDPVCPGCRPCGRDHCAMRGSCPNHVDPAAGVITCPSCIGRTRRDLASIETLYAIDIPAEATFSGVDSEAFNLAGPAAAPDQYAARREWNHELAEATEWRRGWCDYPRPAEESEDHHHPFLVLGRWDMTLREQYGPHTDLFITVSRSVDYLTGLLAGPFPHSEEFETFAREIARCLAHLEAVAHDSRAPERGRPCPRCAELAADGKGPRLRKRYAPGAGDDVRSGDRDTWHCPEVPEHWWTEPEYRDKVAADYRDHATELPAAELAARIGISLSTFRKWTARSWDDEAGHWIPPRLESRRRGADGRKVYPVAAALELAHGRGA